MDPRDRPRTLDARPWLSLAFCLAFPSLWNALLPSHLGAPQSVALTRPERADRLKLPADAIVARRLAAAPDSPPNSRRFGFALEDAGRYSVYGISSHVTTAPLVLEIDGERISTHAFDADTGSRHLRFLRQRLATGVELERGSHQVELRGPHLGVRTFVLELWREAPLGPLRYLTLVCCAGLVLAIRRRLTARPLPPRARLAAVALFSLLPAALALAAVAHVAGPRLVGLSRGDSAKRERLADFESQLEALEQRPDAGRFHVAVLGDSTHYWSLDEGHAMRSSIERALPPDLRDRVRIFGVAARALSAYDYYLLLNRLVGTPTDLVVLPVNVRSFGDRWIDSAEHGFEEIERHLRLDELPVAPGVAVGRRQLRWEGVLLRRLDHALADGRISLLLRGLRLGLAADLRLAIEGWLPRRLLLPARATSLRVWPDRVASDHPLLACFRAIDRLAARHGIQVLYYTVQVDVEALAGGGIRLDLPALYAQIEREIAGAPGIHFLDLSGSNPRWMFSNGDDHLSERGIRVVAQRLAERIGLIARESGR